MDVTYGVRAEQFRREFREWLDANLPAEWRAPDYWERTDPDEGFALRREWEAGKARAGFAGIEWPVEFGGRGGTPEMKAVYDEEMAAVNAPRTVNALGLAFLAPTVMAIGTPEQKRDVIKPLLHNDVIWCQGFSEPGAGSDLAAVALHAEPDGDHFVLNGQKTWTSNARHADMMFALARTDRSGRADPADRADRADRGGRHDGLSMLLVDLHSPGVEVRPLVQMSGAAEFGEVFFTDARVPRPAVLGAENQGWQVAMLLLSFERGASAMGQYTTFRCEVDDIVALARRTGRDADPLLRQEIGRAVMELECLRLHSWHVLTEVELGRELGAAASLTKLQWSETHQDVGELFTDVAGMAHQVADPEMAALQQSFLRSRSETIWGGTSQIQRNIVAERLLGLPR